MNAKARMIALFSVPLLLGVMMGSAVPPVAAYDGGCCSGGGPSSYQTTTYGQVGVPDGNPGSAYGYSSPPGDCSATGVSVYYTDPSDASGDVAAGIYSSTAGIFAFYSYYSGSAPYVTAYFEVDWTCTS